MVKTIDGKTQKIAVTPETTIEDIKEQLFTSQGIQKDQQKILYKGAVTNNSSTIYSLNAKEGDIFHMVLSIRASC